MADGGCSRRPGLRPPGGSRLCSLLGLAVAGALLAGALAGGAFAISNLPSTTSAIVVDGAVNDVAVSGSTVVLGGAFTHAGPYTGGFAAIPLAGGSPTSLPPVNGTVNAVVPDGSGGWFVGGSFSAVGSSSISNLVHILSSGSVDTSWNPAPDAAVNALALSPGGSTLYVGGSFATIGGTTRNDVAALTASTGATTGWNPDANGAVSVLAASPDGKTVYAAGSFTAIGGQSVSRLVALDATSAAASSTWNPAPDNTVSALAVSSDSSTVYIGGSFANAGGASRSGLAALSASGTGAATTWAPQPNGTISALALSGSTVYAGGTFTSIGGQARSNLAALSASDGTATSWDPSPDGSVDSLAVEGSIVYAGGAFSFVGGQSRQYLAAIDSSTGEASSWQEDANAAVTTIAATSSAVGVGGALSSVGLQARSELAAFSTSSGLLSWNPGASGGAVDAVALSSDGSTVYVGGAFTTLGGQSRAKIGAVSLSTGITASWNPGASAPANAVVSALAVDGSTVYAGGTFTTIGGQTRNRLAAIDTTGAATAWNPNVGNSQVFAIALGSSGGSVADVYAGGSFTSVGGVGHNRLVSLDPSTAAVNWDANATTGQVTALAVASDNSTVYAGGTFTTIGGQSRNRIAALSASTGLATSWNPNAGNAVNALALSSDNSTVYAGGTFTTIGGQSRNRLASVDSSGNATNWNPNLSGGTTAVDSIALTSGSAVAGGVWTTIGTMPVPDVATFGLDVPVASASPSVTGTATVGSTLTCTNGTWTNIPTSYAYQWLRDGSSISGATASTYVAAAADVGHDLSCRVTATNSEGSGTATSAAFPIPAASSGGSGGGGGGSSGGGGTSATGGGSTSTSSGDGGTSSAQSSGGSTSSSGTGSTSPASGATTTGESTAVVLGAPGTLTLPGTATLAWDSGAFGVAGTLTLAPAALTGDLNGYSPDSPVVSVRFTPSGASNAAPVFLPTPLALTFDPSVATTSAYPSESEDGIVWTALPRLAQPALAAGQLDGYYRDPSGAVVVYTRHTSLFALLRDDSPPTAPAALVASLTRSVLRLAWAPATDNSHRIAAYEILRGARVIKRVPGTRARVALGLAGLGRTSLYRVRAVDPAGNLGPDSRAVKVLVSPRPKLLPARIPAWAFRLSAWQAAPAARRKERPATPRPLPAWYARWRRWVETRLSLRP